MKYCLFLLCCAAGMAAAAEFPSVQTVYIMPMAKGFDQYLANRLTNSHMFQVVTDPKLADAVFTDRIGEGFQMQLEAISPTPEPVEAPEAEQAPEAKGEKPAEPKNQAPERSQPVDTSIAGMFSETVNKVSNPSMNSSFGRGKGTVFLVETKSRHVIWSSYDPAKDPTSKELDRTAGEVVSRLKKDMNRK